MSGMKIHNSSRGKGFKNSQGQPSHIVRLTMAALCLALAVLLPQLSGRLESFGMALLPMHFPVLLCGFICGWYYGGICGLLAPFLNFLIFGKPPLLRMFAMMPELCVYGILAGLLFLAFKYIYPALVLSMLGGRLVGGIAFTLLMWGMQGKSYGWGLFLTEYFVSGWIGITIQLMLIPLIVAALRKNGLIADRRKGKKLYG
jgi:predicted membrane protein